jgi:putative addiction module component (TIGR02574 family)
MPLTLDEIVEETRQMPPDVVADLVDRIMIARHGGIESHVESKWRTEIRRRISEIEEGKVEGIPVEQALARARKILGK